MTLIQLRLTLCCNLKPGSIMKKTLFTLGLAIAATLTLTNCAKQEAIIKDVEPAKQGVPFELVAGMDTKTEATDAGVVTWKEGDALNVFHAVAGTTEFPKTIKNDQFTFTTGSTFAGTLQEGELTADAYDWYALYPYFSGIKTPANTSAGYTTFRNSQTQTGNSSMAHLCGSGMPLYGKATNVAKDAKPSIEMKQAASIIKVRVTNMVDEDLTVSSISVTTPENIAGNYFINFAGESPSFTEASSSGKKTVTLTVKNGVAIAKNGSADFYIAVKPFTVSSGTITVSVNGYGKDKSISAETVFAAGKIKTINFSYDKVENYLADGDYVIMAKDADKYYAVSVEPNGTSKRRDYVEVAYAGGSTFNTANSKIIWNFARTGSTYKISNGTDYMTVGNNTIPLAAEGYDLTVSENEGIYTITSGDRYLAKNGTYGFGFYAYGTGKHDLYSVPASLVVVPIINVTSEKTMEVSNGNDLYAIEYNISNPIAGKSISAVADVTWIKDFDYSQEGEIAFEVEAQAAAAPARSGKITLSYDGASDVEVTVNQAAGAGAASVYTYVFTSAKWAATLNGAEANWTSGKDGSGFNNDGIQVTSNANSTGANGTTVQSFTAVTKVVVIYNTNKSAGEGTLDLKIGNNTVHSENWAYAGSGDGRTANYTCTFDIATPESGQITLTVNTTTNSIYVVGVNVTASGMTTP